MAAYALRLPTRLPLLWRLMVLSLTLGALLRNGLDWLQGHPFQLPPTQFIFAVALPSVLLWYWVLVGRAGESGLKLFDWAGLPRRVAWQDVRTASLSRWPGMLFAPALKVVLSDGRVRWLPRDSKGLAELHDLALRVAGPDHPLVQVLRTPLHRL